MKWNWSRKNRRRGEAMTADLAAAMGDLRRAVRRPFQESSYRGTLKFLALVLIAELIGYVISVLTNRPFA